MIDDADLGGLAAAATLARLLHATHARLTPHLEAAVSS